MKRFFPCCAVFLLTLFAGCEPFNFTEHFEEQTGRAEAVGWAFSDSNLTEPVIKPDGTVAVAPGDSFIAVTLNNPRNYALSPDLVNEGPPASGVCTALQEDSRRVLVAIRGAALHDEYRLTLKLTSPDGSREFEPYPLPVIRCLSFNTDLDYLRINGGAAALEPGFDPAITSYTARVFDAEGFTLSAAAADPQAELYLDGTPLEGGVEITRTLEAGDNAFTLNVRAENGVSEKAYTLNAKWFADGGGELVSIAEISDYLADAAGGATAANPLPLQVSIALADGGWEALLEAIAAAGKYVALDLAECAMSGTEFDPYTAALGGAEYIVSLVLPDAATSIKAGGRDPSFMHFSGLAVVYGGNITDIGKNAFGM
ncbi:MAG: cadherin-like beta sandwich domain-containing protein, partial [Treponema sp.]|nr:cadherin-like beta sandwich domain-containing protein [Treponema sp.]